MEHKERFPNIKFYHHQKRKYDNCENLRNDISTFDLSCGGECERNVKVLLPSEVGGSGAGGRRRVSSVVPEPEERGSAVMLVDCPPGLSSPALVKKSATENSQLNKKQSYKHTGRYSGSFSPPGLQFSSRKTRAATCLQS